MALLRPLEVAFSLENTTKAHASKTTEVEGKLRSELDRPHVALLCFFEVALVFKTTSKVIVGDSILSPLQTLLFLRSSAESLL